jgi:hypothetical protein
MQSCCKVIKARYICLCMHVCIHTHTYSYIHQPHAHTEMLQTCYKDARKMIDSLIQFELAYINTNHPDFIDVGTVLGTTFAEPPPTNHMPRMQQTPVPEPIKTPAPQAAGPAAEPPSSPLNWFGAKDTKGRAGQQGPPGGMNAQQKGQKVCACLCVCDSGVTHDHTNIFDFMALVSITGL